MSAFPRLVLLKSRQAVEGTRQRLQVGQSRGGSRWAGRRWLHISPKSTCPRGQAMGLPPPPLTPFPSCTSSFCGHARAGQGLSALIQLDFTSINVSHQKRSTDLSFKHCSGSPKEKPLGVSCWGRGTKGRGNNRNPIYLRRKEIH